MRAGQNIVELINKQLFINIGKLCSVILATENGQHFSRSELILKLTVGTLHMRFCGEGATVHLQIKLSVPGFKTIIIFKIFF